MLHGEAGARCGSTATAPREVSILGGDDPRRAAHEIAALRFAARRLARLFGARYVEPATAGSEGRYWVPVSTLTKQEAAALGIVDGSQLWGGIVDDGFAATKLVSHPLWKAATAAPRGWIDIAPIQCCTLPGYATFCRADAMDAAMDLLDGGGIRLKHPDERGGHGQAIVRNRDELADWMSSVSSECFRDGLLVERHLVHATICSVGFSALPGGHRIAYFGTQRNVAHPSGAVVYGGSRLAVVRGGLDALAQALPGSEAGAVVCAASCYDALVRDAYGVVATRCNYDVLAGVDSEGRPHLGVLEQSWRFGGASMAELLAIECFAEQPELRELVAETVESYVDEPISADAVVYWPGDAGSPRKYARIVPETTFDDAIHAIDAGRASVAA